MLSELVKNTRNGSDSPGSPMNFSKMTDTYLKEVMAKLGVTHQVRFPRTLVRVTYFWPLIPRIDRSRHDYQFRREVQLGNCAWCEGRTQANEGSPCLCSKLATYSVVKIGLPGP